ncbi:MAG: hypothetical protein ACKOQN_19195 [Dolichospermum sp.]
MTREQGTENRFWLLFLTYSSFRVFVPHANFSIPFFLCVFAPLREI